MVFTAIFLVTGAALTGYLYSIIPVKTRLLSDQNIAVSVAIILAYVFLTDFIFYWYHRAEHRFKFFWAIHELHHSDSELNATTSMRTYWLERPLQTMAMTIPVGAIVGVDRTALLVLPFTLLAWLFFTHANWKLRLGWLTPIITGPQIHRIHHSRLPEHQGKNFAQFFPILDILFGTYYKPARDEFPPTGTSSLDSNAGISSVMIRPFRIWTRRS